MRKITIVLILALIVIANAEDVLTINPQVKVGETFDELFGTTVGWGYCMEQAANNADTHYIHWMNWCGGLWQKGSYGRLKRKNNA